MQVTLSISAIDIDGLPIQNARGRFIQVTWQRQGDDRKTKDAVFQTSTFDVKFSGVDLAEAGEYRVWVSSVFGHVVNASVSHVLPSADPCKSLPTKNNPCILVVQSSMLKIIIGAVRASSSNRTVCIARHSGRPNFHVHKVLASCAVLALGVGAYYASKNRGKLLKVLTSFVLGEGMLVVLVSLEILDYASTHVFVHAYLCFQARVWL